MAAISLERRYEDFIKRQLDAGRFDSARDVVQAGLDMLEDFEESCENWLSEEIPGRLADIVADPSKGVPADQVFADLEAIHRARLAQTGK